MNGSTLLKKAILDSNINFVFGYTGGAIMPFFDEMEKSDSSINIITSRHEQGAAFMAQGVSRGSVNQKNPQVGICLSTSGPGATNLITGVADALMDSVPIISISGQVASSVIGTDAFQELDIVGSMIPITKQTYMPIEPEDIESTFHEALYIATHGRPGPVHIDLPKDTQTKTVHKNYTFDFKNYTPSLPGFNPPEKPTKELTEKAIELINKSEKPVIFCGHGVRISNAGAELTKFAEHINAPIATTLHGLTAFPTNHPLHLGWMGMHGSVEANRAIQHCDLIISFGMRFDDRVTGKLDEYAKNADIIHVDIDPSEIDKNVKTSVAINADAKDTLNTLLKDNTLKKNTHKNWFKQIEEFRKELGSWHSEELNRGTGKNGKLLMKKVITRLSDITDGKDILVMDVGQHQMISSKYYKFKTVNSCFNSGGAGTMGASLPMAIGVKLVRPNETVWSINGDGGFQMNIQELGSIMKYDFDIKIIILNNEFLGMVRQWQTLFFEERYAGTPMENPEFEYIAKAYKIPYQKVSKVQDIDSAIEKARKHKGAHILEFTCDQSEIVLPMIPSNQPFKNMIVNKPN